MPRHHTLKYSFKVGGDVGTERELTYRAESADIPGRSVASVEHKFQNYGPVNKVAYGQIYGDVTVQFIMSQDMREKEYFEIWQDKMVGYWSIQLK